MMQPESLVNIGHFWQFLEQHESKRTGLPWD